MLRLHRFLRVNIGVVRLRAIGTRLQASGSGETAAEGGEVENKGIH
jgi:hypothetical protein